MPGFALFDTSIGRCGVAWGDGGIVGLQLPEGTVPETRARLAARFPTARKATPPGEVKAAIDAIVSLLHGEPRDLCDVRLDFAGLPPFDRRVYELARAVRPGFTVSYGELAEQLGMPGSARAVGQALGRNPFPIVVPCHRVLAAHGRIGGFSGAGGTSTKLRMLTIEGALKPEALPLFSG
jgi:methylated-DNA-[protein]-cysteine S-methyltransferase